MMLGHSIHMPGTTNELPVHGELHVQEAQEDGWSGHADLR